MGVSDHRTSSGFTQAGGRSSEGAAADDRYVVTGEAYGITGGGGISGTVNGYCRYGVS